MTSLRKSIPNSGVTTALFVSIAMLIFWFAYSFLKVARVTGPLSSGNSLRLAALVGEATIKSPLTSVAPVASLEDLGNGVSSTEIFHENFDDFKPTRFCKVKSRPKSSSRDLAIYCDSRRIRLGGQNRLLEIKVEPSTYYQFVRSEYNTGTGCLDLTLTELPGTGKRHIFNSTIPPSDWQDGSLGFLTGPLTRSLEVEVTKSSRDRKCRMWFDDIRLNRLTLSRLQELSLLKSRLSADKSNKGHGLVKRGRLLPAGSVQFSSDAENHTIRTGLYAPAPTDLVFDLEIPEESWLQLSYGLLESGSPGDCARFQVVASTNEGRRRILLDEEYRRASNQIWQWKKTRLALTEFGGKDAQLALATRACDEAPGHGIWGNPMIHTSRSRSSEPNVVIIAVDTLRADGVSFSETGAGRTPSINALASSGVRFDQAISQAGWTLASFSSLFTGAMPSRHGATSVVQPLRSEFETLAELYRDQGWTTHAIMSKAALYDVGVDQGFDDYFNFPYGPVLAEDILTKAVEWLDLYDDTKFFLFLHFDEPHLPYSQPSSYVESSDEEKLTELGMDLPLMIYKHNASNFSLDQSRLNWCKGCSHDGVYTESFKNLARSLYYGEVAYVDKQIGAFLNELNARNIFDNTIIVFLSDHGEALWDHMELPDHRTDYLYDENIVVPLIIKPALPSEIEGNRVVETQVRLFDVMPTLLDLANVPYESQDIQSHSLVELLVEGPTKDRPAVTEVGHGLGMAVRSGGWKYIRSSFLEGATGMTEHLYDLGSDPEELIDKASKQPEKTRSLRAIGFDYRLQSESGNFLVIVGTTEFEVFEASLVGVDHSKTEIFFGAQLEAQGKNGIYRFKRESSDPLIAILKFQPVSSDSYSARVTAAGGDQVQDLPLGSQEASPQNYLPGSLVELLKNPGQSRAFLFLGGTPPTEDVESPTMDAQQLENLRALGYLE